MQNKVIFTADWHLGKRQYGLKFREQDRYDAAWKIVAMAIEGGYRAILNGGDLLDVVRPHSRAINELMNIHRELVRAGIPMLVVQGNHDRTTPPWYDLFEQTDAGGVTLIDDRTVTLKPRQKSEQALTVEGIPERPVERLTESMEASKGADILLTHVSVRDWIGFPSKTALPISDIPLNRWQYIVIGDTHKTCEQAHGQSTVFSPGSIETGEKSEQPDKSVFVLDMGTQRIKREPFNTRPIVHLRIDNEDEVPAVLSEVERAVDAGALIYITYNPFIPGLIGRLDSKRKDNNSYIVPETNITEQDLFDVDDQEELGDDILEFQHFVHHHTEDSVLVKAFGRIVDSVDAIQDIIEDIERAAEEDTEDAAETSGTSKALA